MATSKSTVVKFDDLVLAAGGPDQTTTSVDLTQGHGAVANMKLANGGTPPTIPAQIQLQLSANNTDWFDFGGPLVGDLVANGGGSWAAVEIPPAARYARFVAGSNTAQAVTARASIDNITAVT